MLDLVQRLNRRQDQFAAGDGAPQRFFLRQQQRIDPLLSLFRSLAVGWPIVGYPRTEHVTQVNQAAGSAFLTVGGSHTQRFLAVTLRLTAAPTVPGFPTVS